MATDNTSNLEESSWEINRLVDQWIEPYARYLERNDLIPERQHDTKSKIPSALQDNFKQDRMDKARDKAAKRLQEESEQYFLAVKDSEVIGHASNILEEGATEMRIRLDDGRYRGQRKNGRTLYDAFNDIRLENAEGIPYIVGTNKKAVYKMENLELEGEGFMPLGIENGRDTDYEEGVIMALTGDYEMEAPETLYVPDGLRDYAGDVAEGFYSGISEIDHATTGELDIKKTISGGCKIVEGLREPSEVAEELLETYSYGDKEIKVDAELPGAQHLVDNLRKNEGWYLSGFTPDIGERYDGNTLHVRYMDEERHFDITEGVGYMLDSFEMPYRIENDVTVENDPKNDSFEHNKSIHVLLGPPSR